MLETGSALPQDCLTSVICSIHNQLVWLYYWLSGSEHSPKIKNEPANTHYSTHFKIVLPSPSRSSKRQSLKTFYTKFLCAFIVSTFRNTEYDYLFLIFSDNSRKDVQITMNKRRKDEVRVCSEAGIGQYDATSLSHQISRREIELQFPRQLQ